MPDDSERISALSTFPKAVVFLLSGVTAYGICNNMRATRANEVEREFGTVAESNWIGHDPGTFRKHYSQVHVADMKKACAIDTNMTQNGGQQSCTESPEESEKASMQVSALLCNLLQTSQVPPLGLEPRTL